MPRVRPSRAEVFAGIRLDYRVATNAVALAIFAGLFALTLRRGARDVVCGMRVDRARALTLEDGSRTLYFCSPACRSAYEARRSGAPAEHHAHAPAA